MALGWEHAVTVVGAFVSAGTAQYLSHRWTLNREDEKYQKERYRKFYAPLVYKIQNYVIAEAEEFENTFFDEVVITQHQRGVIASGSISFFPLPNSDTIFNTIITIIEDNLEYADLQFIEMYERHKMQEFQNNAGDGLELIRHHVKLTENLLVCEKFLIEYLNFSKKISVLSIETEIEINRILISIKLYNLMKKYKLHQTAFILFSCTSKYRSVFARFPNISQEIDRVRADVSSKITFMKKNTGKDDLYCYQELLNFARAIKTHLETFECDTYIFKYSHMLEIAINQDELVKSFSNK